MLIGPLMNILGSMMNNDIREKLIESCVSRYRENNVDLEYFYGLMVRECIKMILFECEDFENGNVFGDGQDGEELWESVTEEYGTDKQRSFSPYKIGIHLEKVINKHFGIDDE